MTRRLAVVVAVGAMLAALSPLVAAVPAAAAPAVRFRNSMLWVTGTNDPNINSVSVGDLNGDGRDDVVAAVDPPSGVRVYYQDDHGLLNEPVIVRSGSVTFSTVADATGDGLQDIVAGGGRDVSITAQGPGGALLPVVTSTLPTWSWFGEVVQLDADPTAELLLLDETDTLWRADIASDGTVASPFVVGTFGTDVVALTVADVDGDGDVDAAARTGSTMRLLFQGADGMFGSTEDLGFVALYGTSELADVSGDGRADLLVALSGEQGAVALRKPEGGFETPMLLPRNAEALAATDVDNDGDADLVTAASSQVFVYLQDNGVLGPPGPMESHSTGQSGSALSFGDLNGDGMTDLISPSYYRELSVSYNETFNRFPVMPNQSMYAYGTLPSPLALSVTDEDLDDVVLSTLVAPTRGSVAYDGATITYLANPGQSGIDRFTVLAEDGRGGFAMSEITVTLVAPGSIAGTVDDGYRTLAGV